MLQIFHQVQKGMLGNMYVLADEFSKYISSVDMKSPMDRLEAFEILNTFLKLDMNLKMDKSRDIKYIQVIKTFYFHFDSYNMCNI